MTNRLKILSFGLAVSLIIAVNDYYQRNASKPRPSVRTKASGSSQKSKVRRLKINRQKDIITNAAQKNEPNIESHGEFLPIPEDIIALNGWARNPFIKRKQKRVFNL